MEIFRNAGHVELVEDGGKMNIILTAFSIKLTAPRIGILFSNISSTPSDITRTNFRQLTFRN
jgi:hypothetical protein